MKSPLLTAFVALALISPAAAQKAKPVTTKAAANSRAAPATQPADSAPLAALFEAYWEDQARLDPLAATARGDSRYNDQLPNDQTQASRNEYVAFAQRYLAALRQFDRAKLSANDRLSYDVCEYELKTGLEYNRFNSWMMPFNQFVFSFTNTFPLLGSGTGGQPFKTTQDYDNWLGRLRQFPALIDSAISNYRRGMRAGVVLPKAVVVKMLPQLRALSPADPTASVFYGPVATFPPAVSAADRARLTPLYREAIGRDATAPYRKLADFLEAEYLPKTRSSSGINALPGGPEMYAFLVRAVTTTQVSPAEVARTGEQEVKRLRGEMERVKQQVGFKGDLPAFFAHLNTDPQFRPFKTPEEVLAVYRGVQAKIEPNLKMMFGQVPKTGFEVRRTEAFREASASAQYNQGLPDGSRPGIFYVPIPDVTQYNVTSGMESLFLHEAIPGHHYQISLMQENTALPKFRRFGGNVAYVEGWALYTESLGKELGLYTDPYQYMGRLKDEMHRAIRLVVDVHLHTGQMTREQAIQYMMANKGDTEAEATAEIERYMVIPGQALGYKVGELKIQELRARYEKQLGKQFSLRDFHDELLKDGSLPLLVLERKMDEWAARQR
ncbi:DUF885 domain-containing protein [Hymenobacter sp. BT188]|uniref:DUF885 domain-containing protein n=1 Tax=Hymenobacter sp. BT188 TaxID=2763504 RepID=UPI0016518F3F|nr:DUF885 domain-containing protein [Hymenobacter sp. BT188]MBC6606753.1 DUF885 domain-containing protein [Hymenobacter sp. BT188]